MVRTIILLCVVLTTSGCASNDRLNKLGDIMFGGDADTASSRSMNGTYTNQTTILSVLSASEEMLVKDAARSRVSITTRTSTISFDSEKNGYTVVTYSNKENSIENIKCIVYNNEVVALSGQPHISIPDPYSFSYASEIAQKMHEGAYSNNLRELYNFHAFIPEVYDDCTILVREQQHEVEYFVYRINVCK